MIGKTTTKSEKLWPTHFSYHSIQWWLLSFFRTITEFFERILPKKIRWLTPPGIAGVVLCRERAVPSLWSEVRRKGTTQWRDLGESSPNWAYRMNRFLMGIEWHPYNEIEWNIVVSNQTYQVGESIYFLCVVSWYETKKVEHCHELWLSIIIQFSIVSRGNAQNKDLYDLYVLPPMILIFTSLLAI